MIGIFYEALKIIHRRSDNNLKLGLVNLIEILNEKKIGKEQIVVNLREDGLQYIHDKMYSNDRAIRKLSAKFLLLLLYKSEHCQRLFSEQFDLTPISGLICLNRIPQTVKKKMRENPKCLSELKKAIEDPVFSTENKRTYWSFPQFNVDYEKLSKAVNDFKDSIGLAPQEEVQNLIILQLEIGFPDPLTHMIGFTIYHKESQKYSKLTSNKGAAIIRAGKQNSLSITNKEAILTRNIHDRQSSLDSNLHSPIFNKGGSKLKQRNKIIADEGRVGSRSKTQTPPFHIGLPIPHTGNDTPPLSLKLNSTLPIPSFRPNSPPETDLLTNTIHRNINININGNGNANNHPNDIINKQKRNMNMGSELIKHCAYRTGSKYIQRDGSPKVEGRHRTPDVGRLQVKNKLITKRKSRGSLSSTMKDIGGANKLLAVTHQKQASMVGHTGGMVTGGHTTNTTNTGHHITTSHKFPNIPAVPLEAQPNASLGTCKQVKKAISTKLNTEERHMKEELVKLYRKDVLFKNSGELGVKLSRNSNMMSNISGSDIKLMLQGNNNKYKFHTTNMGVSQQSIEAQQRANKAEADISWEGHMIPIPRKNNKFIKERKTSPSKKEVLTTINNKSMEGVENNLTRFSFGASPIGGNLSPQGSTTFTVATNKKVGSSEEVRILTGIPTKKLMIKDQQVAVSFVETQKDMDSISRHGLYPLRWGFGSMATETGTLREKTGEQPGNEQDRENRNSHPHHHTISNIYTETSPEIRRMKTKSHTKTPSSNINKFLSRTTKEVRFSDEKETIGSTKAKISETHTKSLANEIMKKSSCGGTKVFSSNIEKHSTRQNSSVSPGKAKSISRNYNISKHLRGQIEDKIAQMISPNKSNSTSICSSMHPNNSSTFSGDRISTTGVSIATKSNRTYTTNANSEMLKSFGSTIGSDHNSSLMNTLEVVSTTFDGTSVQETLHTRTNTDTEHPIIGNRGNRKKINDRLRLFLQNSIHK